MMMITISRVPWSIRIGLTAIWMVPYFVLLGLRASTPFMAGPTMWEALGLPALVSIVSVGVLSLSRVTADPHGIRFWPRRPVLWSDVRHGQGEWGPIKYLRIVTGKRSAHHVLLGVKGGQAFAELVSKHADELPS
jgi:hypothetical protein